MGNGNFDFFNKVSSVEQDAVAHAVIPTLETQVRRVAESPRPD